jgi:hypothetical protein
VAPADHRELVCVLGPGRSGTSTMAGTLAHSGFYVPSAIKGNKTNPAGFFEPRWAVDFHRRLLDKAGVRTLDADPQAFGRLGRWTADPAIRTELREWLEKELAGHPRLVIKDPRMVWFHDLWMAVAPEAGVHPRFVIMLRHPAEVSGSRSEYYNLRQVPGVAGWINVALMSEQLTHGSPRVLVRYVDLTADWRRQAARVADLGLTLEPPPDTRPHPVDDFVDPGLTRIKPGWDQVAVPEFLQVLGDRAFVALGRIADHGESAEVDEELDDIRRDYRTVFEDSLALVEARVVRSRRAAVRKAARKATTESAESAKSVEKQGGPPAAVSGASPTRIHRLRTAVTRRLRHR